MKKGLFISAMFLLILAALVTSCRKDNYITDPSATLEFSKDTVLFDTVFTTIGSTTQLLKVYNTHNQRINISKIRIENGSGSPYRMNVDGINGHEHTDVEIWPNDSMFIFVEVTLDPNNQELPFIVEDHIVFETNGNEQKVNLAAWGQDAYFHGSLDNIFELDCNEIWNSDKPHVVYGIVEVPEGCKLTINAGTQVHCHARSGILVYKSEIDVNGQLGNEVVFQGDRLETFYENLAGQWGIELTFAFETQFGLEYATITRGGIWLFESTGSEIDYAILKNGIIGLQADTSGSDTEDALHITNTIIQNMSAIGLYAQGSRINGVNNLFANCGQNAAAFAIGGSYRFDHCTFANYWVESNRQSPTFYMSNYYEDVDGNLQIRELENTLFRNCIMYGNNAELSDYSEFIVDIENEDVQDFVFEDCFVDTDQNLSDEQHYVDMQKNQAEPPFLDPFNADYDLPASIPSNLNGAGDVGVFVDIKGATRDFQEPTMGCHESD